MAAVAGGVVSIVASSAMGADPMAIATWFQGSIDAMIARIQTGYAMNRQSSAQYLHQHAAIHRAQVEVATGSMDVGRVRSRLEIVGPVGFKSAIARGDDTDKAIRTMATQMAGVADEEVRNGDRDVIARTAQYGRGVVGWRRRMSGHACGFCAMLASRGAVYVTRSTASVKKSEPYHPHCHCWVEPMYWHERSEPPEVQKLQRQWAHVTAGKSEGDARIAWRRHWEGREAPQPRASTASGVIGPPGPPVQVRQLLADAQSPDAVSQVFRDEFHRITGRDVEADFSGSVATAREHAEGVLQGMERYPDAQVTSVRTGPTSKPGRYAETLDGQITFSDDWSSVASRRDYLGSIAEDSRRGWHPPAAGDPRGIALHEFAHVLDLHTTAGATHVGLDGIVTAHGGTVVSVATRDISAYAATSRAELIAEALADVMTRGRYANAVSRDVVAHLDQAYASGVRGTVHDLPALPTVPRPRTAPQTLAQLKAQVTDAGITVPVGLRRAELEVLAGDISRGVVPAEARARAVQTILDERKHVAQQLSDMHAQVLTPGTAPSDRLLRYWGAKFADLPAELKTGPLVEALRSGDLAKVRIETDKLVKAAKLTPVKAGTRVALPGEAVPFDRATMELAGSAADVETGTYVHVLQPGYATKFEDRGGVLVRAQVQARPGLTSPRPVKTTPAKAAKPATPAKRAAAPKATPKAIPPRTEAGKLMDRANAVPDLAKHQLDLKGVPDRVLREWVEKARGATDRELVGDVARLATQMTDVRRATAELVAEVQELLANGAEKDVIAFRAQARLRRIADKIKDWPEETQARKLVAAIEGGDPAAIKRAITSAERALKLERVGVAGKVTPFDTTTMAPVTPGVAREASVQVIRPGYATDLGNGRIVLSKATVDRVPLPEPAKMTSAKLRDELAAAGVGGSKWMSLLPLKEMNAMKVDLARAVERIRAGEKAKDVDAALHQVVLDKRAEQLRAILAKAEASGRKPTLPGWVDRVLAPKAPTKFDPAVHQPYLGVAIPRGTEVIGNKGGYKVLFDGAERIVEQPTVKVLDWSVVDRGAVPSTVSGVPTIGEIMKVKDAGDQDYLLRAGFDSPYGGKGKGRGSAPGPYRVKTSYVSGSPTGNYLRVEAQIFDANGTPLGTVTRTYGKLGADHVYLQIAPNAQGSGFAEAFNGNLYDWYRRSGISKVKVHADIDIGGYVWARQGFDFETARGATQYLEVQRVRIEKILAGRYGTKIPAGLTQQDLEDLRGYIDEMLSGARPASAPALAEFGRKPGQKGKGATWAGKWLMLGTDWHGLKRL